MDLDRTDLWVYSGGYRVRPTGGRLGSFEAEFGLATNDHRMSNERKPNRDRLEARTSSEADGLSGLGRLRVDLSPSTSLTAGVDAFHLARDAIRTRFVVASARVFEDHMWPDASQDDLGVFGQVLIRPAERWRLRAGARIDAVWSDARAVDDPSLGGRTIRENYVLWNGEAASEVRKRETLGTGNVAIEHALAPRTSLYLGGGFSSRAASVTERTFALAPAPGGFQIGNPSLDPELKTEAIVGFETEFRGLRADLSAFHFWFDDYIYQTIIAREDIDGDGNEDVIRGFRNVKARLYGGELTGLVRLSEELSVPIGFAFVRGENRSSGGDLPEIPPLEGTLGVRFDARGDTPWWWEIGGRFVARQRRIDPAFGENETPGFAVIHLRGGTEIGRALAVNLAVENLLDKEYHEHLTREAALPVGGLARGGEVPAPGLALMATVRYTR
jgi:iron complex outermembrane receptor protein